MTPQEKLIALQDKSLLIDAKYRDGKWWVRVTKTIKPRNSSTGPSETEEATADSLEECLDRLLPVAVEVLP